MDRSNLIVDSDIIIDFLRRRSDLLQNALTRFRCHITAITLYEIRITAIKSEQQIQRFDQLLQHLTVLPLDGDAATQAAEIGRSLRTQGQPIGLPDTLIAGICLAQQMPLLTRNIRHYQRVPDLQLLTSDILE